MSMILKSGDHAIAGTVRPLRRVSMAAEQHLGDTLPAPITANSNGRPETELESSSAEVETLNQTIKNLAVENENLILALETAKAEIESTRETALLEGRKAGVAEAAHNDQRKLDVLQKTASEALAAFSTQTESIEGLAILLAQTALQKIIGEGEHHNAIIAETIALNIQKIDGHSDIKVTVSSLDFPDSATLENLADSLNRRHLQIEVDDQLGAGGCVLKLRLGEVDISIPHQLQKLESVFHTMIQGDQV